MNPPDLSALPAIPKDDAGPVFRAPWEAQAFGMAVALHARGCFTWAEWAARLADEIAAALARGEVDDGSRYYYCWLAALEKLVAEKGLVRTRELLARQGEWDRAARATPHGQPIVLRAFRSQPHPARINRARRSRRRRASPR
jgi:nitrile hydratase accessory protein